MNNCGVLHTAGLGNPGAARECADLFGRPPTALLDEPADRAQVYVAGKGYHSVRPLEYLRDCPGLFDPNPRFAAPPGCGR